MKSQMMVGDYKLNRHASMFGAVGGFTIATLVHQIMRMTRALDDLYGRESDHEHEWVLPLFEHMNNVQLLGLRDRLRERLESENRRRKPYLNWSAAELTDRAAELRKAAAVLAAVQREMSAAL
jgi:hypothetical protein